MNRTMFLSAALSLGIGSIGQASTWELDQPHSTIQFNVRHMMVNTVRGQFQKFTGTVNLDDQDMARSKVDVAIDIDSIDTREPKRDGHLKSPDFFDAAKYPQATFQSTKVEKAGTGRYNVTGNLTMHGVTRPVTLTVDATTAPVTTWGKTFRGVSATGKISRKDWGLTWNKSLDNGGVLVGDEIQLQIDAELVEKTPAKTN